MKLLINVLAYVLNFPYATYQEIKMMNDEVNYFVDYSHTKDSVPTFRGIKQ